MNRVNRKLTFVLLRSFVVRGGCPGLHGNFLIYCSEEVMENGEKIPKQHFVCFHKAISDSSMSYTFIKQNTIFKHYVMYFYRTIYHSHPPCTLIKNKTTQTPTMLNNLTLSHLMLIYHNKNISAPNIHFFRAKQRS